MKSINKNLQKIGIYRQTQNLRRCTVIRMTCQSHSNDIKISFERCCWHKNSPSTRTNQKRTHVILRGNIRHLRSISRHPRRVGRHPRRVSRHPWRVGRHPRSVSRHPRRISQYPRRISRHPRRVGQHPRRVGRHTNQEDQRINMHLMCINEDGNAFNEP